MGAVTPGLTVGGLVVSEHAILRWADRFRPDERLVAALVRADPVAWEVLRREARAAGLAFRLSPDCEYRRDPSTHAVFVIKQDVVVTVVRQMLAGFIPPRPKWDPRRKR